MIAERLAQVRARIEAAALRAGRDPTEVTLVGVTKQQPVALMLAGYRAGLQHFGENRVEEIVAKIPAFLAEIDPASPPLIHMIGHLQRRKVGDLLPYVSMIHSVDSVKLAERIDRLARQSNEGEGPPLDVLLQCNVSGEASKYGFELSTWAGDEAVLSGFLEQVTQIAALDRLRICGLMTMAPIVSDSEETRPCFRSLRRLRDACRERLPALVWDQLSMGMTDDFEVAVEEGATLVRVGRAIFPREN